MRTIRLWWFSAVVLAALTDTHSLLDNHATQDYRYETDDAVVIEASDQYKRLARLARSIDDGGRSSNNVSLSSRDNRQFGGSGWPGVLPVGPCFTNKGVLGRCTSFRSCYPYFKLPDFSNWETWVLGMYDTCSYFSGAGGRCLVCAVPTLPQYDPHNPPVPLHPQRNPRSPENQRILRNPQTSIPTPSLLTGHPLSQPTLQTTPSLHFPLTLPPPAGLGPQ